MDIAMARQVASLLAALMSLLAYGGHQMGRMDSRSPLYNILNTIGSAILGYIALHPSPDWVVLLEGAWVLISLYVLLRPKKVVER